MLASSDQTAPKLAIPSSVSTEEFVRLLSGKKNYRLPTVASNATAAGRNTTESINSRAVTNKKRALKATLTARPNADTANAKTQIPNPTDSFATAAEQAIGSQATGKTAVVLILRIATAPVSKVSKAPIRMEKNLGGRCGALKLGCFFKCFR